LSIIDPSAIGTNLDTFEQIQSFINQLGGGAALAPLQAIVGATAPVFSTHTFVSGAGYVNATALKQKAYVQITGGTAGTVGVTLTDTAASPVTHTLIAVVAANAVASQVLEIPIPAGWTATVTTSVAIIAASSVVVAGL
jgi:hypothetical protein